MTDAPAHDGPEDVAVIFDLDGVIADTFGALYQAYLAFLGEHDRAGTEAEFDTLNGPSIPEIVDLLQATHDLGGDRDALEARYRALVAEHVAEAGAIAGMPRLVRRLEVLGVPLALASSSPRAHIERLLDTFRIRRCFRCVVSGDEVARAKPAPDIYRAACERLPAHRYLVVEDSALGVEAAVAAGCSAIQFKPNGPASTRALAVVDDVETLEAMLVERLTPAHIVERSHAVDLAIHAEPPHLASDLQARVDAIWRAEQDARPDIFDGHVLALVAHDLDPSGALQLDCVTTSYRYVVAALREPALRTRLQMAPIGVSGILVDPDGATLIARRAAVTEYPDCLELVPSGGLTRADVTAQLLDELCEETWLERDAVVGVDVLGLIYDPAHHVFDIGCRIRLAEPLVVRHADGDEYTGFEVVGAEALRERLTTDWFVPTSAALVRLHDD